MSKSKTDKSILAAQQEYELEMEKLRENWTILTRQLAGMNEFIATISTAAALASAKGGSQ